MGKSDLAGLTTNSWFFLVSAMKVTFQKHLTVWQLCLCLPGQREPVFHGLLGRLLVLKTDSRGELCSGELLPLQNTQV